MYTCLIVIKVRQCGVLLMISWIFTCSTLSDTVIYSIQADITILLYLCHTFSSLLRLLQMWCHLHDTSQPRAVHWRGNRPCIHCYMIWCRWSFPGQFLIESFSTLFLQLRWESSYEHITAYSWQSIINLWFPFCQLHGSGYITLCNSNFFFLPHAPVNKCNYD